MAGACKEFEVKLIYVPTDFVFDGEKGLYKEEDRISPINYYDKTKVSENCNLKN